MTKAELEEIYKRITGAIDREFYERGWLPPGVGLKLGDIVQVNENCPFEPDWRNVKMKVVSLRADPDGQQWVSVIEGDQRHGGNGVYEAETTDFEGRWLSIVS